MPARFAPQAAVHALGPLGLSSLGVFAERHLFFEFAQSVNDASSLSRRCQVGPAHQYHRASPHLIAPRLPASIIETPIKAPYSPALIPPLESPLTPSPRPSMASVVNRRHFHPEQSRPPIKDDHHP